MEFANPKETVKAIKSWKVGKILRPIGILLITIIAALIATSLTGSMVTAGINAQNAGNTLTFLVLAYLTALLNKFTPRQSLNLIALAVLLSFGASLMQGSFLLIILPWLLKKLRLI
jgi:hypothetical protein